MEILKSTLKGGKTGRFAASLLLLRGQGLRNVNSIGPVRTADWS